MGAFFLGDFMAKNFAKSFYNSRAWISTRDAYIAERVRIDGGMCECCRENVGEELHHIIPLTPANINDFDVCLNPDNLKYLCKDCHFRAHRKIILEKFEEARSRKKDMNILTNGCYMDEEGFVVKARRFIVWGSPASGKTTYVKEHLMPGDLVVDLDAIKYAISFQNNQPVNLNPIAFEIRELLYKAIEDGRADCRNVWVIGCLPKRAEREELAARLGAELVYVKADYKECIERARRDVRDYANSGAVRCAFVDKFFEELEE